VSDLLVADRQPPCPHPAPRAAAGQPYGCCQGGGSARGAAPSAADAGRRQAGRPAETRAQPRK